MNKLDKYESMKDYILKRWMKLLLNLRNLKKKERTKPLPIVSLQPVN